MKCKECAEARKHMAGSRYCVHYGIVIREDHECLRDCGRPRTEETEDDWEAIDKLEERREEDDSLGMADPCICDR